jgi:hypothetical protein
MAYSSVPRSGLARTGAGVRQGLSAEEVHPLRSEHHLLQSKSCATPQPAAPPGQITPVAARTAAYVTPPPPKPPLESTVSWGSVMDDCFQDALSHGRSTQVRPRPPLRKQHSTKPSPRPTSARGTQRRKAAAPAAAAGPRTAGSAPAAPLAGCSRTAAAPAVAPSPPRGGRPTSPSSNSSRRGSRTQARSCPIWRTRTRWRPHGTLAQRSTHRSRTAPRRTTSLSRCARS